MYFPSLLKYSQHILVSFMLEMTCIQLLEKKRENEWNAEFHGNTSLNHVFMVIIHLNWLISKENTLKCTGSNTIKGARRIFFYYHELIETTSKEIFFAIKLCFGKKKRSFIINWDWLTYKNLNCLRNKGDAIRFVTSNHVKLTWVRMISTIFCLWAHIFCIKYKHDHLTKANVLMWELFPWIGVIIIFRVVLVLELSLGWREDFFSINIYLPDYYSIPWDHRKVHSGAGYWSEVDIFEYNVSVTWKFTVPMNNKRKPSKTSRLTFTNGFMTWNGIDECFPKNSPNSVNENWGHEANRFQPCKGFFEYYEIFHAINWFFGKIFSPFLRIKFKADIMLDYKILPMKHSPIQCLHIRFKYNSPSQSMDSIFHWRGIYIEKLDFDSTFDLKILAPKFELKLYNFPSND